MDDDVELTEPPESPRARELWLQHAVGWTLLRDVRDYARNAIPPDIDAAARRVAEQAVDDALYGVMRVIDRIDVPLHNDRHRIELRIVAELRDQVSDEVVEELDLFEGDGFCMGYHGWLSGDFGEHPVVRAGRAEPDPHA